MMPELIVKQMTLSRTYEYLCGVYMELEFFKKYGYDLQLPNNKNFNKLLHYSLEKRKELLNSSEYYEEFKNNIYKKINLSDLEKIVDKTRKIMKDKFQDLKKLKYFKLLKEYVISPIITSPGGSYSFHKPNIITKVLPNGKLIYKSQNLIHEIVHIGVERLIQKYKLSHPIKEYIVDSICKKYLKLKNYISNKRFTQNFRLNYDDIMDLENVVKDLRLTK
jgi:hypothetical protein